MIGVTGATGFIGCHLMESLGDSGLALDLRGMSDSEIVEEMKKHDVNIVVHLASPKPSPNQNIQDSIENENKILAERMVKIADCVGEIYFIFLSSIRVYPNGLDVFDSKTLVGPIDGYGRGKVAAENIFNKSKHRVLSLRTSSVLGVDINGAPQGFLGTFVKQSINENILKVMGDGSAKKDLIHVKDLINLILKLIDKGAPLNNLFLPVGSGESCTVLELAEIVSTESRSEIIFIEPAVFELSNSVNNSEICELSGWNPLWTIEEIVSESLEIMGA